MDRLLKGVDPASTINGSPSKFGVSNISPLRNVLCFARPCDVREMRLLLLEHGAMESKADRKRWEDREDYDMLEPAFLTNFHRDDREG